MLSVCRAQLLVIREGRQRFDSPYATGDFDLKPAVPKGPLRRPFQDHGRQTTHLSGHAEQILSTPETAAESAGTIDFDVLIATPDAMRLAKWPSSTWPSIAPRLL